MARNPKQKQPLQTKKHLARVERERIQRRYILFGSLAVFIAVVGLIGYGVLDQTYLQAIQPVAIVNGEKVPTNLWQAQVRYARQQLIGNAAQTAQFMQMFGSNPSTQSSFANQLLQIQAQLSPDTVGKQVLDQMVDDTLIRQEAKRRGITVSSEELNKAIEEAFNFYPNGTPTPTATLPPIPTPTLDPTQLAILGPSPTPTATPFITPTVTTSPVITPTVTTAITQTQNITSTGVTTPTITPTLAPSPTATPYTQEGYQKLYNDTLANLKKNLNFSESDLKYTVENQLYREKVMEAVLAEEKVSREEEEVWARHILVPDKQTADLVLSKLKAGESWDKLAAEYSTDTSNKDNGGDLGWFPKGQMVAEFEKVAFELKVGQISDPVQTQFGWHIIQVLGHEMRPLTDSQYQQLRTQKFQDWLTQLRDKSTIVIKDYWTNRVPTEPTLPAEITSFIDQFQQSQQQPSVPIPTALPSSPVPSTPQPSPQATP